MPIVGLAALVAAALPVRAALPKAYGGVIRLPSPLSLSAIHPAAARDPFEAAIARAVFDPLYAIDRAGRIRPVLAAAMPERQGEIVTIQLRSDVVRHDGVPLRASSVAASLRRAARHHRSEWLLSPIARNGRTPDIRHVGPNAIEMRVPNERVNVARLLSAAPLAITVGRNTRQPQGTGAYRIQAASRGGLRLRAFRHAVDGAPYVEDVQILPPRPRDATLRDFELARIDASWSGQSLYGGTPVRAVTSTRGRGVCPVLLIPNRSGPLRSRGTWGTVARAIDRTRLRRVNIEPTITLRRGLPPPRIPPARRPATQVTLRLPIHQGDAFEAATAQALAAMLDEAGVRVRIEPLSRDRHDEAVREGRWDLRIATVVPPLPDSTSLVAAALAEAGQSDRARSLFSDSPAEGRTPPTQELDALVLGQRRRRLWHRADLVGARFDHLGRLDLRALSLVRPANLDNP
jgi:peptide/nickel transport system substrate-binding protein